MEIGDNAVCAVTGKEFILARDDKWSSTFNYARFSDGSIASDEGVDIYEKNRLKDRSKPFFCYLSSDGKHVTGWKGNVLGRVIYESESRSGFWGSKITHIRVIDVHGRHWYGKGSGRGMCIKIRATKG